VFRPWRIDQRVCFGGVTFYYLFLPKPALIAHSQCDSMAAYLVVAEAGDYNEAKSSDKPPPRLGDLFAPLDVPRVVQSGNLNGGASSSVSSFDLSSLTRGNDDFDDAGMLNDRLTGGKRRGGLHNQIAAFEHARELALSIASVDASSGTDSWNGECRRMSSQRCALLFFMSFLMLACVWGDTADGKELFSGSNLKVALDSEPYRWALFFSTGCCAPMFFHHILQLIVVLTKRYRNRDSPTSAGNNMVVVVACVMLNLTVLIPNIGRIAWIVTGKLLSRACPLYCGVIGAQGGTFAAVVCGLLTYYLPPTWEFQQLIVIGGLIFNLGSFSFFFGQTVPAYDYNVQMAVTGVFLFAGFVLYIYIVFRVLRLIAKSSSISSSSSTTKDCEVGSNIREEKMTISPNGFWVVLVSNAVFVAFVVLIIADMIRLESTRIRDYDTFSVCYHIYLKTGLMLVISYLLPMRLTELLAIETKNNLGEFVTTLLPKS